MALEYSAGQFHVLNARNRPAELMLLLEIIWFQVQSFLELRKVQSWYLRTGPYNIAGPRSNFTLLTSLIHKTVCKMSFAQVKLVEGPYKINKETLGRLMCRFSNFYLIPKIRNYWKYLVYLERRSTKSILFFSCL